MTKQNTRTYLVVMKDGSKLELLAYHRTHALITAMELCNTKDVPVRAAQLTDW
jgi:hypothetical protein